MAVAWPARAGELFDTPPLALEQLDRVRGGFDAASGLRVSFGVERVTYVNGSLVASSGFQVADILKMDATEAAKVKDTLASALVVRDGSATLVPSGHSGQALSTLIQNSLDGQTIKNLTTISTATNSLAMLRSLNAAASLRDVPAGR